MSILNIIREQLETVVLILYKHSGSKQEYALSPMAQPDERNLQIVDDELRS